MIQTPDDKPLDCWGQWWGRKYVQPISLTHLAHPSCSPISRHYSLQVVQHPLRARMCGFGDKVCPLSPTTSPHFTIAFPKDRRPLAPAAVAKMIVRREDNSVVDVECVCHPTSNLLILTLYSELDFSFFLVTVDLWSADGKREMNLVLHPSSSTDRYASTMAAKPKKSRTTIPTVASPRSDHTSPPSSHSTPNSAQEPHRTSLDSQVCIPPPVAQKRVRLSVSQP